MKEVGWLKKFDQLKLINIANCHNILSKLSGLRRLIVKIIFDKFYNSVNFFIQLKFVYVVSVIYQRHGTKHR